VLAVGAVEPLRVRHAIVRRSALELGPLFCAGRVFAADDTDISAREITTPISVRVPGREPIQITRRRYTGMGDPSWTYQERDVSGSVFARPFSAQWPYTEEDFRRIDEEVDTAFYKVPKLVYHIDEGAVAALTHYYDKAIPDGSAILDICSSWLSHYPRTFPIRMSKIVGSGISDAELACNDQLNSYVAADLNRSPKLPFADRSFDVVTCVVSTDYLTKPLQVMKEVARVLKPGGKVILSQSNRCFYTKAVKVWTDDMSDGAHLRVLGTYLHFAGGFSPPRALDISARGEGTKDPMYIVEAKRL